MSIPFDEKGKFFTEIISKDSITVIIQTTSHRVQGMLDIRPGERLKDEINNLEQFFAITEATIFKDDGKALYCCEFFALNREQIVWILPKDEIIEQEAEEAGGEA